MGLSENDIERIISEGVNKAIDVKAKDFFIGREEHYQHHQFIKELIETMKTSKRTATRTLISAFIISILSLLIYGFWHKIQELFK